ncbi:type II toxin-antitoxin system VapC family toxin [Azospirillum sp. sgz301742]
MIVIVDASVAVRWSIRDEFSPAADRLLSNDVLAFAPDLVFPELANALWKMERASHISAEQARRALIEIPRGFDRVFGTAAFFERSLEITRTLNHPAYDCFYLALSETLQAPLVTLDRRLFNRTRGTPWADLTTLLGGDPALT